MSVSNLKLIRKEDLNRLTRKRTGEKKWGERIQCLPWPVSGVLAHHIQNAGIRYVLLGVSEDIGIRANFGSGGATDAWWPVLESLVNFQEIQQIDPSQILVLGQLDLDELMADTKYMNAGNPDELDLLRDYTSKIDGLLSPVIKSIVESGAIPIVIGGGHNNAYGIIKACSESLGKAVNCLNFDAHADLRRKEGRHSGNGFSYAFTEGLLDRYGIYGLAVSSNNQFIYNFIHEHADRIKIRTFESVYIDGREDPIQALDRLIKHLEIGNCGLELDVDVIKGFPSSASSPSGLELDQARRMISHAAFHLNPKWLHIAEAALNKGHLETSYYSKSIALLIFDFLWACKEQ